MQVGFPSQKRGVDAPQQSFKRGFTKHSKSPVAEFFRDAKFGEALKKDEEDVRCNAEERPQEIVRKVVTRNRHKKSSKQIVKGDCPTVSTQVIAERCAKCACETWSQDITTSEAGRRNVRRASLFRSSRGTIFRNFPYIDFIEIFCSFHTRPQMPLCASRIRHTQQVALLALAFWCFSHLYSGLIPDFAAVLRNDTLSAFRRHFIGIL